MDAHPATCLRAVLHVAENFSAKLCYNLLCKVQNLLDHQGCGNLNNIQGAAFTFHFESLVIHGQ